MKKFKKVMPFACLLLMICVVSAAAVNVKAKEDDSRIAKGVYIGNISVGGMTEEEASDAISEYITSANDAVFTLTANGKEVEVTAAELRISIKNSNAVSEAMDVCKSGNLIKRYKDKKDLEQGDKVISLPLSIDEEATTVLLEEKASKLNNARVNNGLTRVNGSFQYVEGSAGVEVSVSESLTAIEEYLTNNWDGADAEIALVAEVVEPEGTKEELAKVKDLLGSYTTNYNTSSAARCTNISVAAGKIDGTVLYPGEEFSVAATIGPLTAAGGYELAGAYENGQTVESYGGGVCQVSTTMYNAVILAELEVTQRSNHSMIVTYVKPSMDAAIAGDYKDLKFVNNYEVPIYIEAYTIGKNIYFNIYGEETRDSNRVVTYESEVVTEEDPGVQYVATADPVGYISTVQSKHMGYVARLWKVVTVNGVEESREIYNRSTYKSSPKIVNVGTASADPNATAAINNALATGDETAIYSAVSQYNAAVSIPVTAPADAADSATPGTSEADSIIGTVDENEITGEVTTN